MEGIDRDLDGRPADLIAAQRFVLQLAASALEGQPANDARREPPRTQPPLPLSASVFFRTLAEAGFTDGRAVAGAASSLVQQPAMISTWRRTSHLGVCAVAALLVVGPVLGWLAVRRALPVEGRRAFFYSVNGAADRELRWLTLSLNDLLYYEAWERQSPLRGIVERRQALEVYIAGRLRRTMQHVLQSTDMTVAELQGGPLRARMEELYRRPAPSSEEVTRAESVLQRLLGPRNQRFSTEETARRWIWLAGLLALSTAIVGSILSPLLFRAGMLLRSLRLAAVSTDGVEVSRSRALCRAVVAWTPAYLYIAVAAQRSDLLSPVQLSSFTFASVAPLRLPLSGTALVALIVFFVGGLYAAVRPTRGIQDWLTGTWLVPR